jgi:hypothetical protein
VRSSISIASVRRIAAICILIPIIAACGGTSSPSPVPTPLPTPTPTPPANSLPVIDGISIQGTHSQEPANFADAGERVVVTAKVRDAETASDQLQYAWSAASGTFTGSGAAVTWTAPAAVPVPLDVTITLKVTEKYGSSQQFEHSVEGSAALSLHDSAKEVGAMSRQFLLDFSDTNIKDADFIMRNFKASVCPQPGEVASERADVIKNFTFYRMIAFRVDEPIVTVAFGSTCPFRGKKGDACAAAGVMWDSVDTRDNSRNPNFGSDIVAAAYAAGDKRWWLCASDYDGHPVNHPAAAFRYPR